MPDELQTQPSASIVPVEGGNIEISASTPSEMVQGHNAMIAWAQRKLLVMRGEAAELQAAFEHARERKWKSDTLKRHAELALKRVTFYEKFLSALEAGYCVVPNFPVTLFGIRTDKPQPKRMWATLERSAQKNYEQEAKELPAGEGQYQNPQPIVEAVSGGFKEKNQYGTEVTKYSFGAIGWDDMEFPANMARLHVMEAATRAMELKIFDEVGMLPANYKRNPDPILIGRLIDPRPRGYGPKSRVSFMIAWHVDTRTL